MPTLSVIVKSTNYIGVQISGLQNPESSYDQFKFTCVTTGETKYSTTASIAFMNLSPGTTYYFTAEAQYEGIWYSAGSCYGTTDSPPVPQPPYNISVSVSGKNVTVTFTPGANTSYSLIDYYWDGGAGNWYSIYGSSYSFTVPDYSTSYTFDMCGVASDGTRSAWTSQISFVSGPPPLPDIPSYYPTISSRVEGGFVLTWGSSANATSYTLRYKNYSGVYTEVTTTSTSYTLTGLEYGVSYYLSVKANNQYGSSAYTSESTATTAPKTPNIYKSSALGDTIVVGISGLSGSYDYVLVYCYDSNWNVVGSQAGYNNQTVSFSGLVQGITYHFQAWSYFTINGTQLQSVNYAQLDVVLSVRPQSWSWSYSIYSGGNVYNTVQASGIIKAYIMLATEWNNFCARINEFRTYKNLPQYGSFPVIYSESDCTPAVLNNAVWAINAMSFSIPEFTSGNVPASIFNQMRDAINSIT